MRGTATPPDVATLASDLAKTIGAFQKAAAALDKAIAHESAGDGSLPPAFEVELAHADWFELLDGPTATVRVMSEQ